ncbi:MAG: polysaccharide biosynthesis/export family protein [Rhodospirillaceae bacterium]|nr:polysaccharide biosynthesis/export family protein [Rhodospirillaceae bacterium]
MKGFFRTTAIISAFFLAACAEVAPRFQQPEAFDAVADFPPSYIVGPGDELSVVFPFNSELNYEGPIGPDSNFTLPVAGTISTAGKTSTQVEEAISQALTERKIARNPSVSISIRRYAQVVYVGGEVKQPGPIALQNKMDPLQAVIAAGGALDTARTSSAVIIRRGPNGKPLLKVVDLNKLIHTGDEAQAIALRPLDSIFIPKTSIAEANLWVDQYINKILPFQRGFSYTINNQNPSAFVQPQ